VLRDFGHAGRLSRAKELSRHMTTCLIENRQFSTVERIMSASRNRFCSAILFASVLAIPAPAFAQALAYSPGEPDGAVFPQYAPQSPSGDASSSDELPAPLRRQVVAYDGNEPAGTIVIDTAHTFLYLTIGNGKAIR
jgi:hypothetical protein